MSTDFKIRKFDISQLRFTPSIDSAPVVIILGKRGTGKSVLMKDILFHMKDCLPVGCIISGSESCNRFYADFAPKIFIHHEYNPMLVYKLLCRQREAVREYNATKSNDPRAFLILDDCLYDNSWTKDQLMRTMFLNGRHFKCALFITSQYPLGVGPMLRTNCDYIFVLRENIHGNRKRIFDNYASMFPSFEMFCAVLNQTTENFECMVIKNCTLSNQLQDQVFWYKGALQRAFKIGAEVYWQLAEKVVDEEEEGGVKHPFEKKKSAFVVLKEK